LTVSDLATPASTAPLADVQAWWLRLPLETVYENALGSLSHFDALVIRATDAEGQVGWGEACPVAGYSPESPAEAWGFLERCLPTLPGIRPSELAVRLAPQAAGFPFVAAALVEAAEDLAGIAELRGERPGKLELVGTVNTLDPHRAPDYARRLVAEGYRTLKVKVGYDPAADSRRVRAIAEAVGPEVPLRVDANQGYDGEAALAFAHAVPREALEVFEQPVPAHDWTAMAEVAAAAELPIMLDEAIYGEADIRRAAETPGVTAVKLKLSKTGGAAGLVRQIRLAEDLGLDVVVGNGVASDLGCLHEALACLHAGLRRPGEMNGFLKTEVRLLAGGLRATGASLHVPAVSGTEMTREFERWIHRSSGQA
jgi:L-alanine-DL-glutamate epimerase-like enolase superfamily enzyme